MSKRDRRELGSRDWRTLLVAVVVPALFFAGLEILLRAAGVSPVPFDEDPYVGFASNVPLFVEASQPDGTAVYTTAPNKLRLFNAQEFPKDKARGTRRIFCLGGSTTHGRPYDDATSFCGWLRELLPAIDDSRHWEVINGGGVSYASYRTALVAEELVDYQPDLFIVYSGHNEFLEERTYSGLIAMPRAVRGLASVAGRTRLYALLRRAYRGLRRNEEGDSGEAYQLAGEVQTLLDSSVGPDAYHRDDALRDQILGHYRFNLARIVDIARSAGAGVILVTPASNLRHSSPFKSEHRAALAADELARWDEFFDSAQRELDAGRLDEALTAGDAAAAIDDRHAELHYVRGSVLYALERFAEARVAFERARDEDVCPLRALGEVPGIVADVAAQREVPLVDFAATVDGTAPHGIPGDETFFDHVHPKIEVHRTLALQILESMRSEGLLDRTAGWNDALVETVSRRLTSRLDRDAHGRALLNLSKVLGWAGKLEEAGRLAVLATETAPDLAETHYQAGLTAQLADKLEEAIGHYRRALRLAPNAITAHGNLAAALEADGQTLQAILHYRRAIMLLGDEGSPYKQQLMDTLTRLGATP